MRACTPRVQEVAQLKVKARHKNKDRWMKTGLNKFKGNRVRKNNQNSQAQAWNQVTELNKRITELTELTMQQLAGECEQCKIKLMPIPNLQCHEGGKRSPPPLSPPPWFLFLLLSGTRSFGTSGIWPLMGASCRGLCLVSVQVLWIFGLLCFLSPLHKRLQLQ